MAADGLGVMLPQGECNGIRECQGLALGLDCPCFPLSTLAAVAGDGEPGETILALLDARRREVYAGLYALDSGVEATNEAADAPPIPEKGA